MFNDDFKVIQHSLENNINFSFIKMNDGEINCIMNRNSGSISRGAQECNEELANKLEEALLYANEENIGNYYVGIPCKNCYHGLYNYSKDKIKNYFNANLLINSNFDKTYELLNRILPNRDVLLICNEDASIDNLPFKPRIVLRVQKTNSWDSYELYKDAYKLLTKNSIAIFCCGPLGRVLAYEWYKNNKDITCLELGSFYDPWTAKRAYMYHTGVLPICSECNPVVSKPISDELISKCHHLERYYYGNYKIEFISALYRNHISQIRQYYLICSKNIENYRLRYYCEYMFHKYDFELNKPSDEKVDNIVNYFLNTYPNRVEAVFELRNFSSDSVKKVEYLEKISKIKKPENEEMIRDNLYDWEILHCLIVDAYYQRMYELSYNSWKELMNRKSLIPAHMLNICIDNGRYAKMHLDERHSYQFFLDDLNEVSSKMEIIRDRIPKIFHFIFISGGHPFVMAHYLAIKSCFEVQKPDKIIVWYNDVANVLGDNKWWNMLKDYATMVKITIPTYINNHHIWAKQHQADVMRVNILNKIGGVYMDVDVLSLHPLDGSVVSPLYEDKSITDNNLYNRDIVLCRETAEKLCNCVIMARNNHKFLEEWVKSYENEYGQVEDWWVGLSVRRPHELSCKYPELKITVLETPSFMPFMFLDNRIFRHNTPEVIQNSLVVHLWDTESFKYDWIPRDEKYFDEYPDTLFTNLFKKYIKKNCVLQFHQGITDIINCISLVAYYSGIYDNVVLLMRDDMKDFTEFFIRKYRNVKVLYYPLVRLDLIENNPEGVIPEYADLLYHGYGDNFRKDKYKYKFYQTNEPNFVRKFYDAYDIDPSVRIDYFNFERDIELENKFFEKINPPEEYILIHEDLERNLLIDKNKDCVYIDLNNISICFFDAIKLIENAKEIHLIDSSWMVFIYLLDTKYKILNNKKVYCYFKRGYNIYIEGCNLDNWITVE